MKFSNATFAFAFAILLFFGCSKKDKDTDNPDNGNPPAGTISDLPGAPASNRYVVASRANELLLLNPLDGTQQTFFNFDDGANVSSLDFANEVIYAGAMDNSLNAISLATKSLLWDVPLIHYENTVLSSPKVTVKDGVAYAVGLNGVLAAIDINQKKVLWAAPLEPDGETDATYHRVNSPTIAQDKIIVGTDFQDRTNYIYVLNKNNGTPVWIKELAEDEASSGKIIVSGNTLLISSSTLLAWDLNTGHEKWEFNPSAEHGTVGIPVVSGNKVFLQGADGLASGKMFCLDLNTGQKLWDLASGITTAVNYVPKVIGNYVFGVEEHGGGANGYSFLMGRPFVADINTGKIIWKNKEIFVESSPVYANGRLFFYGYVPDAPGTIDERSGVISLDAGNGKLLWLNKYFSHDDHTYLMVIGDNGIFRSGMFD